MQCFADSRPDVCEQEVVSTPFSRVPPSAPAIHYAFRSEGQSFRKMDLQLQGSPGGPGRFMIRS